MNFPRRTPLRAIDCISSSENHQSGTDFQFHTLLQAGRTIFDYQIKQRSLAPTTRSIIAFLRRPPIKCSANEIFIDTSNGGFAIDRNCPAQKPISFLT
ncbi:hypothetical protein SDJN02_08705, partial [Cucurbita argyrosperma subsp. argyrosperma]